MRQKFKEDDKQQEQCSEFEEYQEAVGELGFKSPHSGIEYNKRKRREASEPPRYY